MLQFVLESALNKLYGLKNCSHRTIWATAPSRYSQTGSCKAVDNRVKLYRWHPPEVECISKGKSRNPYEFGVKLGLAMTLKGNLILGARSFPSNSYDGHTMHEQIAQSAILMQGLGVQPEVVHAALGYRGVDKDNSDIKINHRGKDKRLTDEAHAAQTASSHRADHRAPASRPPDGLLPPQGIRR